jgi:signal transduction histidine kinase
MLRKKLLARLGLLVVGFVTGAVVSLTLLQGVLRELDEMKGDAATLVDGTQDLSTAFTALETQVEAAQRTGGVDASSLVARKAVLTSMLDKLSAHPLMQGAAEGAPPLAEVRRMLPGYFEVIDREAAAGSRGTDSLTKAGEIRARLGALAGMARRHVAAQQGALSQRLRLLIVGLTVAALIMTNIAIFILVRTAGMILRPIGELIEGSRELAKERFEHRIRMSRSDEFDELARAYNALGEQLQLNEERKVKALQQLAVTLNHELNNVINAIDMQLQLMGRRSGGDPALAAQLGGIHQNLERMARTVASLREVRRVVLTDYLPGQTMLDLPRSTAPDDSVSPGLTRGESEHPVRNG